jgi:FkbM family methyltransferase
MLRRLKRAIGFVPNHGINYMLKGGIPDGQKTAIVSFVNNRPNWFGGVDRKILVRTKFGFPIWCDRWDVIGQTILATGQWEGLLSRTILACLEPGDVAIDIGANMGYDTMLMSKAVGADGIVMAFEPDRINLGALLENLKLLDHDNVVVQSMAVSDAPGLVRISLAGDFNRGTSNLRPDGTGPSQPVLATRLDRLVGEVTAARIRLVKMDIEGFEHKALLGMGSLLERIDYLTCEVSPQFLAQCGSSAQELFDTMYAYGFTSYCAEPNSDRQWIKSDANYNIQASQSHHFDALFCRSTSGPLRELIAGAD